MSKRLAVILAFVLLALAPPSAAGSEGVLTPAVWRALDAFRPEHRYLMARIAWCESRFDPAVVGAVGEQGIFQVRAIYWGPVPSDMLGQAEQAARIVEVHGTWPWSMRDGCEGWR